MCFAGRLLALALLPTLLASLSGRSLLGCTLLIAWLLLACLLAGLLWALLGA